MGSLRVRHDWATSLSLFTFMHWRRKWQPTPVFLPGESQGQRSLVGCRPWGRLKQLSSSSNVPRCLSGKEPTCQCRRCGFNPWIGKIPWKRKWQPTPVFLPGKSYGQRSLAGSSPWGRKRVWHNLAIKTTTILCACVLSHLCCIQLCATPWIVARQAPLSMEFSRQEYWSGLSFPFPEHSIYCPFSHFLYFTYVFPKQTLFK